jgi:conjugative transfer pilus assembly protein TraH
MNKLLTAGLALLKISILFGDNHLDNKIDQFFQNFNVASNVTSSEYLNSNLGVNFLGSSGTVRANVYDVNPIHVQLPSFTAGCGGIDFTLGGINIASKDEMKKALKSIATNGIAYAFLLGIETVSPVISSTMKQIQTWANQLNAININSCEIATSLVQGAWPKTQRASSYICEHAGSGTPLFRDLIEARHGCREAPKRETTFAQIKNKNQDIFVGDYNIAWKALSQMSLDEETKNLFMNITGTIVVKEISKNGQVEKSVQVHPPMYKKALELLRFGGSMAKAYKIDKNEIDVTLSESLKIKTESAWKHRIFKLLKQIQEKILNENKERNQALTDEERNLINTTHFPMGSLLSLMTQYNGKGAIISIDRYSDLIAFERVLKFAEEVARDTLNKAEALRAAQVSGYELDEYIKQVHDVLKDLQVLTMENYQKISAEQQTIDYLINIDRTLREKERGV